MTPEKARQLEQFADAYAEALYWSSTDERDGETVNLDDYIGADSMSSTPTTQNLFHAMRGHVRDGQVIHMSNGDTCTLRAVMGGWQLFDQRGRPHSVPTDSAHVVECIVTSYPDDSLQ